MKLSSGNSDFEYDRAIAKGDRKRLEQLKRKGVRPCELAILHAVKNRHGELIPLLASAGADPNESDGYGDTALGHAVQFADAEVVRAILDVGASPETECMGTKPLVDAARYGKGQIVQFLLSHGANPNAKEQTGLTALLEATRYGYAPIVALLVEAGADVRHKGPDGLDSISLAKKEGRNEIIQLLDAKKGKTKTAIKSKQWKGVTH